MVFGSSDAVSPCVLGQPISLCEAEWVAHIRECRPEIYALDCGTMNFAEADYVMTNTPGMLRAMAVMMQETGVRVK